MLNQLIEFFNKCDPQQLKDSLDELDRKVNGIFSEKGAEIDDLIVNAIKDRDANFYVWFCFLKANFSRGRVVISNRVFKRFCNEMQSYDFYYAKFPEQDICPHLEWRYAKSIETVLQGIKERFGSGKEFVNEIKKIAESYDDPLLRYLELVSFFKGFKGISNKIANAILGELEYTFIKLREYEEHSAVNRLLKEK